MHIQGASCPKHQGPVRRGCQVLSLELLEVNLYNLMCWHHGSWDLPLYMTPKSAIPFHCNTRHLIYIRVMWNFNWLKNRHQTNICLLRMKTCVQNMITNLDSSINITCENLSDPLINMRISALIMDDISVWAPKIKREVSMDGLNDLDLLPVLVLVLS